MIGCSCVHVRASATPITDTGLPKNATFNQNKKPTQSFTDWSVSLLAPRGTSERIKFYRSSLPPVQTRLQQCCYIFIIRCPSRVSVTMGSGCFQSCKCRPNSNDDHAQANLRNRRDSSFRRNCRLLLMNLCQTRPMQRIHPHCGYSQNHRKQRHYRNCKA